MLLLVPSSPVTYLYNLVSDVKVFGAILSVKTIQYRVQGHHHETVMIRDVNVEERYGMVALTTACIEPKQKPCFMGVALHHLHNHWKVVFLTHPGPHILYTRKQIIKFTELHHCLAITSRHAHAPVCYSSHYPRLCPSRPSPFHPNPAC